MFAEGNPKSYTSSEVCPTLGLSHSWIDPYRYKLADLARERGSPQLSGGRIDFLGSPVQSNSDLDAFRLACQQLNAISAFAISIDDLGLNTTDAFRNSSLVAD